jgi:pyruvate dehydrogenase E1 component alpha subunit
VADAQVQQEGLVTEEGAIASDLLVALYEHMTVARALDERLVTLQREGHIAQHASAVGEEAAIVGAAAAMRDEDWLFLSPRETAAALWRGVPLLACLRRAFGTGNETASGREVPLPPFSRRACIASVSPLVGTQIPHAVGVAWAARIRHQDLAVLVFFGDGATSSSDFHAGLNFAGVTRAPIIALCRNNGQAMSMPASRQTASRGFAIKAVAYGIRGVCVDGGDVIAVFNAVRAARERAAAGEGGTLIEALTAPVLDKEDDKTWSKRDPLARLRSHMDRRGLWSKERDERLLAEAGMDIDRAVADARGSDEPRLETLFSEVYAELPWHLREQRDEARRFREESRL